MSIRDIIAATTPGPWHVNHYKQEPHDWLHSVVTGVVFDVALCEKSHPSHPAKEVRANADFIATFDPEHVALMEDAIQAYRAAGISTTESIALTAYRKERGLL